PARTGDVEDVRSRAAGDVDRELVGVALERVGFEDDVDLVALLVEEVDRGLVQADVGAVADRRLAGDLRRRGRRLGGFGRLGRRGRGRGRRRRGRDRSARRRGRKRGQRRDQRERSAAADDRAWHRLHSFPSLGPRSQPLRPENTTPWMKYRWATKNS